MIWQRSIQRFAPGVPRFMIMAAFSGSMTIGCRNRR